MLEENNISIVSNRKGYFMKKLGFFLLTGFLLLFPAKGKAACSNSENVNLKDMAGNIRITYVFKEENATFDITLSNIRGEFYVKTPTNQILSSTGTDITVGGYAPGQSYGFKVYTTSPNCPNKILLTKYATVPSYNRFYNDDVCKDATEYHYCQKWVKHSYDHDAFVKVVNQYKEDKIKKQEVKEEEKIKGFYDYLLDIYTQYYYVILPIFIILCIIVIIQKKKKEEFF